jgi:hypothetical protein
VTSLPRRREPSRRSEPIGTCLCLHRHNRRFRPANRCSRDGVGPAVGCVITSYRAHLPKPELGLTGDRGGTWRRRRVSVGAAANRASPGTVGVPRPALRGTGLMIAVGLRAYACRTGSRRPQSPGAHALTRRSALGHGPCDRPIAPNRPKHRAGRSHARVALAVDTAVTANWPCAN